MRLAPKTALTNFKRLKSVADLVGLSEIARRINRPYNTVKKWRTRYADSWPAPVGAVGGNRAYWWGDFVKWCRDMGWEELVEGEA
jgi:hypothetical protein